MSDKPDTPHPEEDPTLHRNPASGVPADESSDPLSQEPTRVIGDESIPLGAREISPSTRAPGDPSQVGQYRIIGRIGSGAMGVVYRAEQASPKRIVALKVIRSAAITPNIIRRFKLESEILGRLRHPGIAQIYESGIWSSGGEEIPYFAMEYISDGRALDEWVVANDLSTHEILSLFSQICDAVHHAHQKGVMHRDLKPANILVGSDGRPRVIDFGVARGTDPEVAITTLETAVGVLIGTLQYMSPEQCKGDPLAIDTRCDVYALGVVLYELLCKQLPYNVRGKALQEALRVVQEDDPTAMSSVNRRLRGDIEVITLKALEKEPRLRYQSASDFGQDVRRYLEGMPIAAVPHSAAYRIRKFVRRNRIGVIASGLVFAVGIVLLVAAWQWSRADAARQERNRMVSELIDFYMVEHFEAISRLAGSQAAREVIVERSLEYLDNLRREAEGDPELQFILAKGLQAVGNNHWSMRMGSRGRLSEAIEAWESSLSSLRDLRQRRPDDEKLLEAAIRVRTLLVDAYLRAGRDQDATSVGLQAFGMLPKLGDPLQSSERARLNIDVLLDHANLAETPDQAIKTLQTAAGLLDKARVNWPDHAMLLRDASVVHNRLGHQAMTQKQYEKALGHFKSALKMSEIRMSAEPEGNSEQRDVMLAHRYIAQALIPMNQADKAVAKYADRVIPLARQLAVNNTLKDGTIDMRSHRDLCIAQREHGELLLVTGHAADAADVLSIAHDNIASFMHAYPEDTTSVRDYGRCGASLAGAFVELDQYDRARATIGTVRARLIPDDGTAPSNDSAQVLAYCDVLLNTMRSKE